MAKSSTSFTKGGKVRPKNPGRKKGSVNKITLDLIETLKAKGFDPAAFQVEMLSAQDI